MTPALFDPDLVTPADFAVEFVALGVFDEDFIEPPAASTFSAAWARNSNVVMKA